MPPFLVPLAQLWGASSSGRCRLSARTIGPLLHILLTAASCLLLRIRVYSFWLSNYDRSVLRHLSAGYNPHNYLIPSPCSHGHLLPESHESRMQLSIWLCGPHPFGLHMVVRSMVIIKVRTDIHRHSFAVATRRLALRDSLWDIYILLFYTIRGVVCSPFGTARFLVISLSHWFLVESFALPKNDSLESFCCLILSNRFFPPSVCNC